MAAVANTIPGAICYHEPVQNFASWQVSLSLWEEPRYSWVGISDSAMGFHLAEILPKYRPRVLIIERDQGEVEGSLRQVGIPETNYCSLLRARLGQFAAHRQVRTVPFSGLNDAGIVRDCLAHLMPGAMIDGSKIATLQRLNIQADVDAAKRAGEVRKGDIAAILGPDIAAEIRLT